MSKPVKLTKTQRLLQSFQAVELLPEHRNSGNEGPYLRDFGISAVVASALIRWGETEQLVCTFENAAGRSSNTYSWEPLFLAAAVRKHLELFGEDGKLDLTEDLLQYASETDACLYWNARKGGKMKPAHLDDDYWSSMTPENQSLYIAVRPLPTAAYTVDTRLAGLEDMLDGWAIDAVGASGSFELEPDFQRGHVWTQAQRVAYMEALIRKTAPVRILFNCPGWTHGSADDGDIPDNTMQCIDGLQRLTAVRKFLAGEFTVFGGYSVADMKGSAFDPGRLHLQMAVYEFNRRSDLLQFYLDLNSGGSVHAPSELERVGELLRAAKAVR